MDKSFLWLIGGIGIAAGLYYFLSKKNNNNNNNHTASAIPLSNKSRIGGSDVNFSQDINNGSVTVTFTANGGEVGNDSLTSFTPPNKSPHALHAYRYTNGVKTGEMYIDGTFAYVKGYGDGSISWTYNI